MHAASPDRDIHRAASPVPSCIGHSASAALGSVGSLVARLAETPEEIAAAQKVRFRVFHKELGACKDVRHALDQHDADRFDDICDHLLVLDMALPGPDSRRIVGTYRLLRQQVALASGGFYSSDEFELDSLVARHPGKRFLELGRSCVLAQYRSKRTIEALWQGIWAYVNRYGIDVMTGCASFPGTDSARHAEALSYLAQNCRLDPEWDVRAVAGRYSPMNLLPREAVGMKSAITAMPPLIKAYLRIGARIGDGCVVDRDFGTVDVFVVMPVTQLSARHVAYYGGEPARFVA